MLRQGRYFTPIRAKASRYSGRISQGFVLTATQPSASFKLPGFGASAVQGRKVYGLKVSKPKTLYIKRIETAAG